MSSLAEVFKNPQLEWLVERLVKRIEQGRSLESGSVSLKGATAGQRSAVDDLLGRRSTSGENLSVPIARLGTAGEIAGALSELRGKLRNLRAERDARRAEWDAFFARWEGRLLHHETLSRCLGDFARSGLLKRLCSGEILVADGLIRQLASIIEPVPHGDLLLASLAAQVSGDSHALDRGRPLAALCLHAIRDIEGIDGSASAEKRRAAWESIGITVDDLSAPVLCLNLRAVAGSDLAPWIDWHVARGEPFFLTFRQLLKFEPDPSMPAVFVCENPAVVSEAANRLGASSHALVCTNGLPNSGVKRLLAQVSGSQVPIRLRADFDWAGLGFVHQLMHLEAAQPWRMAAGDYAAGVGGQALNGAPFKPAWAKELAAAMEFRGVAVYEEAMVAELVGDLERPS